MCWPGGLREPCVCVVYVRVLRRSPARAQGPGRTQCTGGRQRLARTPEGCQARPRASARATQSRRSQLAARSAMKSNKKARGREPFVRACDSRPGWRMLVQSLQHVTVNALSAVLCDSANPHPGPTGRSNCLSFALLLCIRHPCLHQAPLSAPGTRCLPHVLVALECVLEVISRAGVRRW